MGSAGGTLEDSAEFKDDLALAYCPNSRLSPNLTVKRITQKGFSEAKPQWESRQEEYYRDIQGNSNEGGGEHLAPRWAKIYLW